MYKAISLSELEFAMSDKTSCLTTEGMVLYYSELWTEENFFGPGELFNAKGEATDDRILRPILRSIDRPPGKMTMPLEFILDEDDSQFSRFIKWRMKSSNTLSDLDISARKVISVTGQNILGATHTYAFSEAFIFDHESGKLDFCLIWVYLSEHVVLRGRSSKDVILQYESVMLYGNDDNNIKPENHNE